MNIAQEIYESVQELYQEIVKVDLNMGKAVILHSIAAPSDRGKECLWDRHLNEYMESSIYPGDHERLKENFCVENLKRECDRGRDLFSSNFTTLKGHAPENHVTFLAFSPEKGKREKLYVLLRNAGEEYLMWSIVNQYVSATCDYFIYLDAKNNSYRMFASREGTPLPPVICDDYEAAEVEYARNYVAEEDQEMVIREMHIPRILEVLEHSDVHSFTCGILESGSYARKRLDYRYYDRERKMILLSRTDVTNVYLEEQRKSRRLEELLLKAQTDPLTKIWNFQATYDAISEKLTDTNDNYAFYFVDLDNFKQINDTLGHPAGDEVLRKVANVLKDAAGAENLAGRVGGDEFVVFIKTEQDRSRETAEKILDGIRNITVEGRKPVKVSGSVGIAIAPRDGRDYYALLKQADACLYQAKSEGKDRWCSDAKENEEEII